MKNREEIINLYILYGELLTKKQNKLFKYYYFEDLSLSEISENLNISKSYIGKSLQIIVNKLEYYEKILKLNDKNTKIISLINDDVLREKVKKIINE